MLNCNTAKVDGKNLALIYVGDNSRLLTRQAKIQCNVF